jgi:transposase
VAQRWLLVSSTPRQSQGQRTGEKVLLRQGTQEMAALQKLCRTPFACAADAEQAVAIFQHSLQATSLPTSTLRALPQYRQRGRPRKNAQPDHFVYQIEGALASLGTVRQARIDPQSCCILATNALDAAQLSPLDLLQGYQGQGHAERGFRFLTDPQFLASSLYRKKPERIMALFMVMTVCLLVYAALEYRIPKALHDHDATFPNQKGKPGQNPTARWVFHYFSGIHWFCLPGQWPLVLNLTADHQHLLQLLGKPYTRFYH